MTRQSSIGSGGQKGHRVTANRRSTNALKDGVVSPDLEKSLLGAEVNRIVGSLTLGWYESIFQSYWASKPVKVVSSMGEQSIGKSFTLNHLVDTSFARSTMRTTEGVWMSVSPTEDVLIVALDFEGVHSLECSVQEDALLIPFNTAISNLVLFRNNFALSRDISGLFNPASNPSLFRSKLVIIIKDVIDMDKAKKVIQMSKMRTSRLHAGKLQIIPWSLIKSRELYKLFSSAKKKLGQQKTSHRTPGEFLQHTQDFDGEANDWGAMSPMAAHHTNSLLAILLVALEMGYSEDFDTDLVIEAEDTEARFLFAGPDIPVSGCEHHLSILRDSWDQVGSRRVAHVDKWLKLNIQCFQAEHASIEDLCCRTFNSAVIDLPAGVQLCRSQCATCNLFCIQSRFHEGDHNCLTSHECIHDCTFCIQDLLAARVWSDCRSLAGRSCCVDAHLCGQPCGLSREQSCVDKCVKPVSHEGDHVCSAPVHTCGQLFTCSGICHVPIYEEHTVHACKHRLCPITRQLCERLCSGDHLHGLSRGENHICGYSCSALCSATWICQIDTTPQPIEATFTGRQETFQYTKRLRCVKMIEPGEEHETRRHGSMSQTRWAIDGAEGNSIELDGRKFSSNDDGLRFLHIDERMVPNPDQDKDWITHGLHWRRSALSLNCPGPEHTFGVGGANAQPSRCTLSMFHPPVDVANAPDGLGYASNDGHHFRFRKPIVMQQAFHV
ncbi:hypothetical protein V8E53_013518 [Lactarius tabidus]